MFQLFKKWHFIGNNTNCKTNYFLFIIYAYYNINICKKLLLNLAFIFITKIVFKCFFSFNTKILVNYPQNIFLVSNKLSYINWFCNTNNSL